MADTNQVGLSYIEESTFGEHPGTGSQQRLRFSSESLKGELRSTASDEIRQDRQTLDLIRTGFRASGNITGRLSYGAWDDFFGYLLQAGASAAAAVQIEIDSGTTLDFDSATGIISSTTNFDNQGVVGRWVEITSGGSSPCAAGNTGYFKITAIGTDTITVVPKAGMVTETAKNATIDMGAQWVNGTTFDSISIERDHTDVASVFERYRGMAISSMRLNVPIEEVIGVEFGLLGKTEESDTATDGSGYTAAPTADVMNTVDHVVHVIEGTTSIEAVSLSMNIENNLRELMILGTLGADSIGSGKFNVTGSLEWYFADNTRMDLFRAGTASSIATVIEDSSGNCYIYDLPQVKFTDAQANTPGENQDIIGRVDFQAYMDPTETQTMRIVKFDA